MRAIGMNPGHSARVLGAGEMAAGAISAGFVMRGSDPLGEDRRRRFGSEERWLGRFSGPAGSPRLERMYYDRAFPSSLFRTNFLISLVGVAGAGLASRSHSPSGLHRSCQPTRNTRSSREERRLRLRVRWSTRKYEQARQMDCEPVTNRHERTRVVIPIISPAVIARSAASPRHHGAAFRHDTCNGRWTGHQRCQPLGMLGLDVYFNDSITAPKRRPGDHKRRIAMLPSYDRKLTVPVLVLLLSVATAGPTLAQKATPAAYPVAPDPSECVIDPAPIEEIAAILGTPVAEPAVSPSPFVPPASQPADPETSAKVVATLRQIFACANAGDPLRFSSLFTDDFVRNFFADVPLEDLLDFLAIPPEPLPENQERIIIRLERSGSYPTAGRVSSSCSTSQMTPHRRTGLRHPGASRGSLAGGRAPRGPWRHGDVTDRYTGGVGRWHESRRCFVPVIPRQLALHPHETTTRLASRDQASGMRMARRLRGLG